MLKMIVAMDNQQGIGLKNKLPWHIPEDLKLFKEMTLGHTIVMGKNTFLSIGRLLPGRKNIVVSHDLNLAKKYPGIEVVDDFISYLNQIKPLEIDVYIIGGASLYQQALPYVEEISISRIHGTYECDVFFPKIDENLFDLYAEKEFDQFKHQIFRRIK